MPRTGGGAEPQFSRQHATWLHFRAQALYQLGRYPEAVGLLKRRIVRNPETDASRVLLAACYGQMSMIEEAREAWREALHVNPAYSLEQRRKVLPNPNDFERVVEGAPVSPAQRLSARQRACRHPARGLLHPSGNRLCGRLELARQLLGRASRSHQIDHLSPELRRISGSATGHQTPQKSTSRVSTKPGQLQLSLRQQEQISHSKASQPRL